MNARSKNAFDLLRLAAAFMVLWSHQFAFFGLEEPAVINGFAGVAIFFGISGYLNTKSVLNGSTWWRFLVRRGFRIFPGLVGVAVFCVLLGATLTTTPSAFWKAVPGFIFYNSTALFDLRLDLPGVFEGNTFAKAINGSLWTLPIEMRLYIYLAIGALIVRYRPAVLLSALTVLALLIALWLYHKGPDEAALAYSKQFAIAFVLGGVLALTERLAGYGVAICVAVILAAACAFAAPVLIAPGVIAIAAVALGKLECPIWMRPPIDISYGIYLYAFPVQQLFASFGLAFWPALMASAAVTIALAALSALLIEQPALRLSNPRVQQVSVLAKQPKPERAA